MQIPKYLEDKLSKLNINIIEDIIKYGPIKTYALLKKENPSLSFNALFSLYSICNKINFSQLKEL